MAVILRLQGLAVKADAHDIRTFFKKFFIPDGRVCIVGGSRREAFIAFTCERDAQLAMQKTGTFLKGDKVTLHISSMAELEHTLKLRLNSKEQKGQMKTKEKVHLNMKTTDERPHLKTKGEELPVWTTEKLNMKKSEEKNLQMKRIRKCQMREVKMPRTITQEELNMKKEKLHRKRGEERTRNKPSPTQHGVEMPQPPPHVDPPAVNAHNHYSSNVQCDSPPLHPTLAKMRQSLNANTQPFQTPAVETLDPNTAFLLGMCTVLQGLQSSGVGPESGAEQSVEFPTGDSTSVGSDVLSSPELTLDSCPGYVRLFGAPASTTKQDIGNFFTGLKVEEVIVNVKLGTGRGCLVKFASTRNACEALHFNNRSMGHICVEVRGASEKMWTSALHDCENAHEAKREASHSLTLRETANSEQAFTSLLQKKRQFDPRLPQRLKKPRLECDHVSTPSATEYVVMARNLPKTMTKTDAMELFQCQNIGHRNVLHLLDKNKDRTDTVFLIFNCPEDYNNAMNLNGCHVNSAAIEVSAITNEKMRDMMAKNRPRKSWSVTQRKLRSA